MKQLLFCLLITLSISSCSKEDNEDGKVPDRTYKFILKAENSSKEAFNYIQFNQLFEQNTKVYDLEEIYDSIVWKISNQQGSFKVFEHNDYSYNIVHYWSHTFFLPGKYQTYLLGYKNNELIHSDSTLVEITYDKDFLAYNWKDIKTPANHSTGYVDVIADYYISTYANVYQNIPSVSLRIFSNNKNPDFITKSKDILTRYINSLYSSPTYDATDKTLSEKYEQLFTYKMKRSFPESIWITPKAKIVLLKSFHNEPQFEYVIFAEPSENR